MPKVLIPLVVRELDATDYVRNESAKQARAERRERRLAEKREARNG